MRVDDLIYRFWTRLEPFSWCTLDYLMIYATKYYLRLIRRIPSHPRIAIERRWIFHVAPSDIAVKKPWTDHIQLISHMFPCVHAKDIVHLFHGSNLPLCARHKQPYQYQGKCIETSVLQSAYPFLSPQALWSGTYVNNPSRAVWPIE